MSSRSAKSAKVILSCCLSAAAVALAAPAARAASIYIGDDAAEGTTITAGGGAQADTVNPLTYAFTGTGSTYTAATAQTIKLTEVNFIADEGPGNLTPFVAAYNGGNNQLGASYTVLAIGDPIAAPTGAFAGGGTLQNAAFTISGVNPQINLAAGQVLVAGLFQTTRIVLVGTAVAGPNNDYINSGNSLPASTGQALTSDSDFGLSRTMRYNVGFDVVPEPSAAAIGLTGFAGLGLRRRRRGPLAC